MVKSKTRRAFCLQFFFCFILLGLFGVRPTVPREIIDRLENLHSRFDELRSPFMFHLAFRIVQLDSQLILGREKWPRYSSETSESRSKRVLKNFSGLMSRCAKFIFLLLVIFIARKKRPTTTLSWFTLRTRLCQISKFNRTAHTASMIKTHRLSAELKAIGTPNLSRFYNHSGPIALSEKKFISRSGRNKKNKVLRRRKKTRTSITVKLRKL